MEQNDYASLIRHMEWADARVWMSTLKQPSSEHDAWIRERFHHYHSTQWAYGQALLNHPIEIPELISFPDLKSVGLWARRFYTECSCKLIAFGETELSRTVDFPWSALVAERYGSAAPATAGQTIVQLGLHSSHHRGQIAMHIRNAGGEPPVTDFIAWIWLGCPVSEWGILATGETVHHPRS